MVLRIRDKARPADTSRDIDLGPAHAQRTPLLAMRRPIDEAIVYAAGHGHQLGRRPQ